jgi:hypothetical protein
MTQGRQRVFSPVGTGVLVAASNNVVFLVTAKHVFDDPRQGWHPVDLNLRFAVQEDRSFSQDLGWPIILTNPDGGNLWQSLPDGSDIAAVILPGSMSPIVTDAIGVQNFATVDDVFDGASVFVFGYPGEIRSLTSPDSLTRAVTRSGIIAWTDPKGPLDNPLLLDSNLMPGNSGGPAFRVPGGINKFGIMGIGGPAVFLGIVSQNVEEFFQVEADGRVVLKQWEDRPIPSVEQVGVIGVGGLGKIEPAAKVQKLLDQMTTVPETH